MYATTKPKLNGGDCCTCYRIIAALYPTSTTRYGGAMDFSERRGTGEKPDAPFLAGQLIRVVETHATVAGLE